MWGSNAMSIWPRQHVVTVVGGAAVRNGDELDAGLHLEQLADQMGQGARGRPKFNLPGLAFA